MSGEPGTLELIAIELGHALAPLSSAFHTPEHAIDFFHQIGVPLPLSIDTPGFQTAIQRVHSGAHALASNVQGLTAAIEAENAGEIANRVAALLQAVANLIQGIDALVPSLTAMPTGLDATEIAEIAKRILDRIVIDYLEDRLPVVLSVLELLGIAEHTEIPHSEAGGLVRPIHRKRVVHYDQIPKLFNDPLGALKATHRWGEDDFDGSTFIPALAKLIDRAGIPVVLKNETVPSPHPVMEFFMFRVSPTLTPPRGLEAALMMELTHGERFELAISRGWTVAIVAEATLAGAVTVQMLPPANFTFAAEASASGSVGLELGCGPTPPATKMIVFGQAGGTRLELEQFLAGIHAGFRADTSGTARGELRLESKLEGGKVVLQAGESDGFLRTILPQEAIELAFDFGVGWSSETGFYFTGSASLETTIVVHKSLGPLLLESISLGLRASEEGLAIDASVSGGGVIGPIAASIDRIGVSGLLEFRRGNLGDANFDVAFKPPNGLGIRIEAGPVAGGGFVSFDHEKGRYSGVLQLTIMAVSVTAIGIIDTKLPNGQEGFSFLVIIAAKFTPIQLGFGFTLNGVGGLLGIHRTVVTDVLRQGLREGTLDHILFPQDPVAHADELIRDLSAVFPPAADRYVFGPMVAIGWGTPTLVEAQLGILIEVPDPVRIVLIGQVDAYLPDRAAALVELHLDVLGILDFGQKLFSLDASLHDSRIAMFSLFGDMAMRLSWGDDPSFAFSLGGLNPHFTPPPGFPSLRRLTVALGAGDAVRISLQTYFAITSNSLQFGAQAELFAGDPGGFNVYGWLGFDALFIFSPFSFRIDINAGVAIRSGTSTIAGVRIAVMLSGPSPWHIKGEACISILFFDLCVPVEERWGDETPQELPTADPWPVLQAAILEVRNWSTSAPPHGQAIAVIEAHKDDRPPVMLDPFGGATWREKVLPLNRPITKFGEARPIGPNEYRVSEVTLSGTATTSFAPVSEQFAPAQFEDLSDADKLSAPSFEKMDGGISIDADSLDCGPALGADLVYQTKLVDEDDRPVRILPFPLAWQAALAHRGASALAPLKVTGLGAFALAPSFLPAVRLKDEIYVAISARDLQRRDDVTRPTTKTGAMAAVKRQKAPRDTLALIALHELD